MKLRCKQCDIPFDIYDYEGAMKHIKEIHGDEKQHDYDWKIRNFGIEMDDGKLYNCK